MSNISEYDVSRTTESNITIDNNRFIELRDDDKWLFIVVEFSNEQNRQELNEDTAKMNHRCGEY